MPYETFVQEVRDRAGLSSNLEAIDTAKAVLETLFECLPGVLAGEVAMHLPTALRSDSLNAEWTLGERLTIPEFLQRIARRESKDGTAHLGNPSHHAQAVLQLLGASVGEDLVARVRAEMPLAFDKFWGADPALSRMHQPLA